MATTAILIDGAFFIHRFRKIEPHNAHNPQRAADLAYRWALAHLSEGRADKNGNGGKRRHELYRIFFYDCPPLEKKMHNPITGKAVDFGRSSEATFALGISAQTLRGRSSLKKLLSY
jgi:hypothetical protein